MWAVNVLGVVNGLQAFAPRMSAHGRGQIVSGVGPPEPGSAARKGVECLVWQWIQLRRWTTKHDVAMPGQCCSQNNDRRLRDATPRWLSFRAQSPREGPSDRSTADRGVCYLS